MSSSRVRLRATSGISLVLLALGTTSCFTNILPVDSSSSSATSGGLTSAIPSSGATALSALTRVVATASDPSGSFDLVGDGSGIFGQFCVSMQENGDETTPSSCKCAYSFTDSDGNEVDIEADTIYREPNLIRCSRSDVPLDATNVKVSVHFTNTGTYTNVITYNPGAGAVLDLTSADSFQKVQRYQCKDAVYIPYLLDTQTVYDPILSEDPSLSYPLDFYAANPAVAINAYVTAQKTAQNSGGSGWVCPQRWDGNQNDPDMRVYSVAPDSSGNVIYPPPSNGTDRATFYLAKAPTGVFTVPVNAFLAPQANSSVGSTVFPPLGYGASPIPRSDGSGEDCPNITLPTGYQWVKVWLFRGSLADRKVPGSGTLTDAEHIVCTSNLNDGWWDKAHTQGPISQDCGYNDGTWKDAGNVAANDDSILADRIVGTNATTGLCLRLDKVPAAAAGFQTDPSNLNDGAACTGAPTTSGISGAGCVADPASTPANPQARNPAGTATTYTKESDTFDNYNLATDLYTRVNGSNGVNSPSKLGCMGTQQNDGSSLNACYFDDPALAGYKTSVNKVILHDRNPTMQSLDGGVSRFDFLFVVSPPDVMASDMKNSTSKALPYIPYRFYSSTDCKSMDPNNPSGPTDCLSSKIITYGVKLHDINSNGDAPAGDPGRLPVFPVCALQPKS